MRWFASYASPRLAMFFPISHCVVLPGSHYGKQFSARLPLLPLDFPLHGRYRDSHSAGHALHAVFSPPRSSYRLSLLLLVF
jgi:hypothetical protein